MIFYPHDWLDWLALGVIVGTVLGVAGLLARWVRK